jgi:hypothetical protein
VINEARIVCATPLRRVPIPLAELGRYPMQLLLAGAMVFDWHTHLRHDVAPALHRSAPASDDSRVAWSWRGCSPCRKTS